MTSVPVKGLVGFFVAYGNAITAAIGTSSVIAVGSWHVSALKKDIEMNKNLHEKDIEMNKKDIEIAALRVERDVERKLLDLAFTEELKPFRQALAAKREAEITRQTV
mmetsp:Transcript_59806/g.146966  ORF Transcript_59806/g.146966 Transcript_59806/m.146966 type:complete len:107 (-) Transcript_59806:274-594(-)